MHIKQVVVITGASSGIGFYTALTFARKGYVVFASVRDANSQGAKELVTITKKENLDLQIIIIDVTDEKTIKKGVRFVLEKASRIDVLVNNAGVMHLGPIELFTIDEIKSQFEVNYFGMVRMIQEVVPVMRKQKSGMIINVSSINGLLSFPLYGIYSSSKFALETMSEVLKFELHPFGIAVALVEPGTYSTNFWTNRKQPKRTNESTTYNKLIAFLDFLDKKQKKQQRRLITYLTHPQRVADAIYNISQQHHPKLRHVVGYDAKLFCVLKALLPEKVRFYLLRKAYKW